MWAFALASFVTGVAGAPARLEPRTCSTTTSSRRSQSIILFAVVLMGGIYTMWGALVAAFLFWIVPAALHRLGRSPTTGRRSSSASACCRCSRPRRPASPTSSRATSRKLGRLLFGLARRLAPPAGARHDRGPRPHGPLRRRDPARRDDAHLRGGHLRPDRPQRRRQDDVLQRALGLRVARPPGACARSATTCSRCRTSGARAGGCDAPSRPSRRSRSSRSTRTWRWCTSTPRAAARERRGDVLGAIDFVGIEPDPDTRVGTLGARDRRLVEIARAVVGKPRLVLLDEPAAGLPDEETEHLGRRDPAIPEHMGALVILVDHDMSLVSACCGVTAVLDFGALIASGPTAEVLRDERVMRAYLGTEEAMPVPTRPGATAERRPPRRRTALPTPRCTARPHGRARQPRCRRPRLARCAAGRGHGAARPQRRRQVEPRAGGRRRAARAQRVGRARRARADAVRGPRRSARPASRSCPRAGACCRS